MSILAASFGERRFAAGAVWRDINDIEEEPR